MEIETHDNPNCAGTDQFVFNELGISRPIRGIRIEERGVETICDVTGVEEGGGFFRAQAVKIADSGAGFAYLIYGGRWGIRLRPKKFSGEPWDFSNKQQWGEPFKIYGSEDDILYENGGL